MSKIRTKKIENVKIPEEFNVKYRPKTFSEIIGNETTVKSIERLVTEGAVKTYMLYGERGCGKTTLARIMSNNLGVKSRNDIKELNLGDAGGKDDGRALNRIASQTTWSGGNKVFIIDEIQGASSGYFQTILKMLEEPKKTYFILCTTDPDKIPKPIRSRCSQHKVDLLDNKYSNKLIKRICEKEGIYIKKQEIRAIIKQSEGCPREILSLLQKIKGIEEEDRLKIINNHYRNEDEKVIELCRKLIKQENWSEISSCLKALKEDPESIRYVIVGYLNSVLLNSGDLKVANMIDLFENSFIYSKKAGLTKACRWAIEL